MIEIVYVEIPIEQNPEEGGWYCAVDDKGIAQGILFNKRTKNWTKYTFTHVSKWLKRVPFSTLIGEKDKEIAAREKEAEFLNEKINQYVAELSSLKSRVLEIAVDIFDNGFDTREVFLYNLKKELNI